MVASVFSGRCARFGTDVGVTWRQEDVPIFPPAVWLLCLRKRHILSLFIFDLFFGGVSPRKVWDQSPV